MGTSFNSGGAIPNPPTDISLSSNSIDENSSGQTNVGSLTTTDGDGGSHTYSLFQARAQLIIVYLKLTVLI